MRKLLALFALLALTSCGFGAKERLASQVEDAADRTLSGPVAGTLRAHLKVLDTGALSSLATQPPLPTAAAFEVRGDRSRLAAASAPFPDVVFTDERIFLKRPDAGPREARPWLELPLSEVTDNADPFDPRDHTFSATRALVVSIDPRILLDIAAAPLTGSIEDLGTDGGVDHFKANFDLRKAMDERRSDVYDDERIERVGTLLSQLSVGDGVVPGEVWFTADGIERVQLGIPVSPSKFERSRLDLHIVIRAAQDTAISEPSDDSVIVVDSLAAIQRSASRGGPQGSLGGIRGA